MVSVRHGESNAVVVHEDCNVGVLIGAHASRHDGSLEEAFLFPPSLGILIVTAVVTGFRLRNEFILFCPNQYSGGLGHWNEFFRGEKGTGFEYYGSWKSDVCLPVLLDFIRSLYRSPPPTLRPTSCNLSTATDPCQ